MVRKPSRFKRTDQRLVLSTAVSEGLIYGTRLFQASINREWHGDTGLSRNTFNTPGIARLERINMDTSGRDLGWESEDRACI